MKPKSTKRRGPGRPRTTGSDTTKRVSFAVGEAERIALDKLAKSQGIGSVGLLAKRATLALLLVGCFNPQYGEGTLHCAASGQCPSGYMCYSDLCYTHEPVVVTMDASMPEAGPDMIPEVAPRLRQLDESCDVINARTAARSDNCDTGLICVEGNVVSVCMQTCRASSECGQAICEQRRVDALASTTALVCGRPTAACDPTVATSDCPSGRVCYLEGSRTICETQSGDVQNGSCLYSRDCLPRYTCATTGPGIGRCQVTCIGIGFACPSGLSCLAVGGETSYCF